MFLIFDLFQILKQEVGFFILPLNAFQSEGNQDTVPESKMRN